MTNERIIDSESVNGARIEIVEITQLNGAKTGAMAEYLYFAKQSQVNMKMIRIILDGGSVMTESGALYYSYGNIKSIVETGGITGMIGKGIKSKLTNEKAFNPVYTGTGTVILEPTFAHYVLLKLNNESFIVDKGLYYCSIGDIEVKPVMQSNFSSAIAGGEGLFQTEIKGTGVVALEIPVPVDELEIIQLNNEKAQVDGNFALLRSGNIRFSVQKSTKGIIGTMASGEGLLNTFEGTGMLWLAPTAPMYRRICMGGIGYSTNITGSNNLQ